ncbi:MAG: 3'-5' exonuclease [Tepidisphaeraceae bacterium]|jgi:DNA polymerase III epsilon subunit family exonuclease
MSCEFSLLHRLGDLPLAFVDVETSGMSPRFGCKVIEIGIVRVENGVVTGQYEQLIDPRRRISPRISEMTGITPAMCLGQPTFARQIPAMMPFLRGAAVVGHNVRFDLSFLTRELRRAHLEIETEVGKNPVFDTVRIARRRFGRGGNSLQALSRRLGIEPVGAHRALADAKTTFLLFQELICAVGGWDLTLADIFFIQGGPMHLENELDAPDVQLSEPLRV